MPGFSVKGRANLSTNPSFEYGTAGVEVRRNLITNPGFRASTTGWTNNIPANAPAVVSSTDRDSGFVYKMTAIGPYGPGIGTLIYQANVLTSLVLYTASVWVRTSRAATMAIRSDNADRNPVSVPANTWTRLSATWTNATFNSAVGVSISGTNMLTGDIVEVGDFLVETGGALLPFFDGSYNTWQSPDLTPFWVGAINTSASVLTGVRPTNAQSAYGNPVWISTDSPHHGQKFARTYAKIIGAGGVYIYGTDTSGVVAGEQMTYEATYRVSRTVTVSVPNCTPTNTNGGQAWPGLSPQLSTAGVWYTKRATLNPTWDNSGYFINISVANSQYGDIIDLDEHFVIRGTYAGSYFDGNSSDSKWMGTANNSHSLNSDIIDSVPTYANMTANYMKRPSFKGTGPVADGWTPYWGSGSPTGTRSLSNGVQTITCTSLVGGNRRFGLGSVSPNHPSGFRAFEGEMIYVAVDVDLTALDPNTRFGLYIEPNNGSSILAFPETTDAPGSKTRVELRWAVPAGQTVTSSTIYVWIKSVGGTDWSGTSTVKVSNVIFTKRKTYDANYTYPYFDGDSPGAQWTGVQYQSASVKQEWTPSSPMRWSGTSWVKV